MFSTGVTILCKPFEKKKHSTQVSDFSKQGIFVVRRPCIFN